MRTAILIILLLGSTSLICGQTEQPTEPPVEQQAEVQLGAESAPPAKVAIGLEFQDWLRRLVDKQYARTTLLAIQPESLIFLSTHFSLSVGVLPYIPLLALDEIPYASHPDGFFNELSWYVAAGPAYYFTGNALEGFFVSPRLLLDILNPAVVEVLPVDTAFVPINLGASLHVGYALIIKNSPDIYGIRAMICPKIGLVYFVHGGLQLSLGLIAGWAF